MSCDIEARFAASYSILTIIQGLYCAVSFGTMYELNRQYQYFSVASTFWLLNALYLLFELIYFIFMKYFYLCGNPFKLNFAYNALFLGLFFFWSILFINPCGVYLTDSDECISRSNGDNFSTLSDLIMPNTSINIL